MILAAITSPPICLPIDPASAIGLPLCCQQLGSDISQPLDRRGADRTGAQAERGTKQAGSCHQGARKVRSLPTQKRLLSVLIQVSAEASPEVVALGDAAQSVLQLDVVPEPDPVSYPGVGGPRCLV